MQLKNITPVLAAMVLLCTAVAVKANVIMTPVAESDGVVGYHYGGSFGSWQIVNSSGSTAATYYSKPGGLYDYQMIVMEFPTADALSVTEGTAALHVYVYGATDVNINYAGEGDGILTYSGNTGSTMYADFSQASEGWVAFDVTPQVFSAIDNNYDWMSFVIIYTEINSTSATIATSESGSLSPYIEIIPEPTALLMLVSMGPLMILRRGR